LQPSATARAVFRRKRNRDARSLQEAAMKSRSAPLRSAPALVSPALVNAVTHENKLDSPVVVALRRQVANAYMLYANFKRYHWQTFGPNFRDLHELFDEFAAEVLATIDPMAERIRMIGPNPPAHPLEWTHLASVTAETSLATMREMVEEADRNALIVIKEMREGVKTADEHDDPGTVDMFSRFVQVHEKHEWWLRDILRPGNGLNA
jgi:starvation-inducible DNA-binding protein